jgi:hypothetical protein
VKTLKFIHYPTWLYLLASILVLGLSIALMFIPGNMGKAPLVYMPLIPFSLGFLPSFTLDLFQIKINRSWFTINGRILYHIGVTLLTIYEMLDGLFNITTNQNILQPILLTVAVLLLVVGLLGILIGYRDPK